MRVLNYIHVLYPNMKVWIVYRKLTGFFCRVLLHAFATFCIFSSVKKYLSVITDKNQKNILLPKKKLPELGIKTQIFAPARKKKPVMVLFNINPFIITLSMNIQLPLSNRPILPSKSWGFWRGRHASYGWTTATCPRTCSPRKEKETVIITLHKAYSTDIHVASH